MDATYEKIMSMKGSEDYKEIAKRWKYLSENIKKKPTDEPIILPDMLWVAKSGTGITSMLKLTAEYLSKLDNLMEFYGDVKFFEFLLSYCPPDRNFTELNRLMDEVHNAAGFRSEFKGIIHINIDEWIRHYEEKHFISFMEYLSAHSDNWLIILSVSSNNSELVHNLNAFLAMYLRLETIKIELPKTEDLFGYIERKLGEYGLTLTDDAKALLHKTIEKIRKNKYFDGYKTLRLLCQDIVYDVFSKERVGGDMLDAKDLEKYSSDSEYIKRMIYNFERVARKIGFEQ
ncbi:MAG: hypothetical protein IKU45_04375 [Clostridia bacterium]|nr:hypothetical protein [Clostridia bacterium]